MMMGDTSTAPPPTVTASAIAGSPPAPSTLSNLASSLIGIAALPVRPICAAFPSIPGLCKCDGCLINPMPIAVGIGIWVIGAYLLFGGKK